MKVFISWSGGRSKAVAKALYNWIPNVLQTVKPWMSEQLAKGVRWNAEIAAELSESRFGIVCLTPENITAPWLLFETGALSKTLVNTFVCPYLYELKPNMLQGPLTQFQSAKAEKEDTLSLLRSINQVQAENALPDGKVELAFDKWWPDFKKELSAIPPQRESVSPKRTSDSMVEEILEIVRRLDRRKDLEDEWNQITKSAGEKVSGRSEVVKEALRIFGGRPSRVVSETIAAKKKSD